MKTLLMAMAALLWLGCRDDKGPRYGSEEENRQTAQDVTEAHEEATDEMRGEGARGGADIRDEAVPGYADKTGDELRQTGRDAGDEARQTSRDIGQESRQTSRDVGRETRQTARDVGEGVDKAADKTREEARQTSRDIGEAFAGDMGKTDADKHLNARIRAALENDGRVSDEASSVTLKTTQGVVQLQGRVDSREDKQRISRIAGEIAGMANVDNDLEVTERLGASPEEE